MLYFTEETNHDFNRGLFGWRQESAATQILSQTVRGKIWIWLQLKYKLNSARPLGRAILHISPLPLDQSSIVWIGRATVQGAYNNPLWASCMWHGFWPLYSLYYHIPIVLTSFSKNKSVCAQTSRTESDLFVYLCIAELRDSVYSIDLIFNFK